MSICNHDNEFDVNDESVRDFDIDDPDEVEQEDDEYVPSYCGYRGEACGYCNSCLT